MFKRIMVPLDGSALSERVLPIAMQLADSFGSTIDLLYVIPTSAEDVPEDLATHAEKEAEAYLNGRAESLAEGIDADLVGYRVEHGYPALEIIEQAESVADTLILMSTHGYSGVQRLLLGSVASKVVQAITTPLLLVPADAKNPSGDLVEFERLIVPLDGSDLAESILPYVVDFCKMMDMELILVRSYHPSFPGTSVRMREVSQIVHDSAENYVKDQMQHLKAQGLEKISYKILRGLPAEQITDFAIETPNSVTAMCTHGRQGIGRWVLGSVTRAVIQCSEEPVLVIRGTSKDS